jgi:hypothetical protein
MGGGWARTSILILAPELSPLPLSELSTPINSRESRKLLFLSKKQSEGEDVRKTGSVPQLHYSRKSRILEAAGFRGGVKHSAGTWWCGEMECGNLEPGKPHPWAWDRMEMGK